MIRRFFSDKRGNYALLTVISIVPILGGLALGVDYAEMSRQRQVTLNALDASGIATARRIIEGVTDDEAKAYAKSFFEANLGSVAPSMTTLTVLLPQNNTGGGTLKLTAGLKYKPYFFRRLRQADGQQFGSERRELPGDIGNSPEEHARGGARPRQFGIDGLSLAAAVPARSVWSFSRMLPSSWSTPSLVRPR